LLLDNLTPEQRRQYAACESFIVTGGESGKLYCIRHGRQQNVGELDANGFPAYMLCFYPSGGLVAGDVMLAQKVALELFEAEAIKVANRFAVSRPHTPPHPTFRVGQQVVCVSEGFLSSPNEYWRKVIMTFPQLYAVYTVREVRRADELTGLCL